MSPDPTPPPSHSNSTADSRTKRRSVGAVVFAVLFGTAMGARVWLQRRQNAEREAMLRSLAEFGRENDQRMARKNMEDANKAVMDDLARSNARLQEMQRRIEQGTPKLAPMDAGNSAPTATREPQRSRATEMPGHLVIAAADVSVGAVDQARSSSFRDRKAKKEVLESLRAVMKEMTDALGDKEQFSDFNRVASLLPRTEAALARLEETMKPGDDKKMAVDYVTNLRDELRDFVVTGDGGIAK